jgi:signal transduction histidine kinase
MKPNPVHQSTSDRIPIRRSLFLKYFLSLVGLVVLVLLINGVVDSWLAYNQAKKAAIQLQAEKAVAAAQRTEQFIAEIERQIGWTTHPQWATGSVELRRFDYVRLLRQVPAITELVQLDGSGREQLRVSRLTMDVIGSGTDFSDEPRFREAQAHGIWFSPVYFHKDSEPYLTIAAGRGGSTGGVTFAEVNLKLIWDVVASIKVGRNGYAFVVDRQGRLIAHPDTSLVLRNTNLSVLPQVATALAALSSNQPPLELAGFGTDLDGQSMLSAYSLVPRLGWVVFVELPLAESLAHLFAILSQTGMLILGGLGLSALAGLLLTRRVVGPILRLQEGAMRLGHGDLSYRIDVHSGDELERLADGFNRMAEQIEESHRYLEARVEERTRDLTDALAYQTATGDVLKAISRSTLDLQPVLNTLIETAARLCRADGGHLLHLEGGGFRLGASLGLGTPPGQTAADGSPLLNVVDVVARQAIAERRPVLYDNATNREGSGRPNLLSANDVPAALGVPLLRDGGPIGAIVLCRGHVEGFTRREIDIVVLFADQAVIAIENARLMRELQERSTALATSVEELKALGETGQAVSGTLNLTQVLDLVTARAVTLGQADACIMFRYRRTRHEFTLWHSSGLEEDFSEQIQSLRILEAETVMGAAIRQRMPIAVTRIDDLPQWPLRDAARAAGFRSILVIPLVRAERVFGTLVLLRREEAAFPKRTNDLMKTFANQSVLAIQNARLFRELEEKSRQLEAASQHKSQFLANMSHELRTPLNAVLGYTEMLLDGVYGEVADEAREIMEYIQGNGEHLLALINDVLDLSKIEAGQLTLMLEEYAVLNVIEAVIAVAQPLARAKGLELHVRLADDLPLGRGDERRLTQVLMNLVGNAIKFTDQGSVEIAVSAAGGMFEFRVTDTGPGIAPAHQVRIFEAFQQIDNSSTRHKGGTGLGLAISKRIVQMHGGTVLVESSPGQGSTFRVSVPIRVDDIQEAA